MTVRLPDGTELSLPGGATGLDVAKAIGPRLAEAAVAVKIDGELVDLGSPVTEGSEIAIVTLSAPEGIEILRHSTAHLMAQAVTELFPDASLAIGPSIEDGFYYDFDLPRTLTPEDLEKVEKRMKEIVGRDTEIIREELPRVKAVEMFKQMGQDLKVELIEDLPEGELISVYRQGDFVDLCRGPHVPSTGRLKVYKLLSIAGAYWRGDESRPMLQRIYGTSFADKKALKQHLERLEEAAKRDHRKLGKELDLYSIHDSLGAGLPIFHPKGATLRFLIEDFLRREHRKRGYDPVVSPHIMKADVWKTSGHYQMGYPMYFFDIDEQEYGIKPMNCPAHIYVYGSHTRSYRDLPLRLFELGTVYRHERSGVLHGLLRVRGFTQDDAHLFVTPDDLDKEIIDVLDFAFYCLKTFGFDEWKVMLSTRPEKSVGTDDNWDKATKALITAMEHHDIEYTVDEGEGVFYGPKIDVKLKDAIGRLWQGPTIQVDFNLPERFDLNYIGADNEQHRPVMIHRVVLGSMERFIGALIEHHGGAFPAWLSPEQIAVVPVADRHIEYANKVRDRFNEIDARIAVDGRSESVSKKIRDHQLQKVPYMLVVGDQEEGAGTVAVRQRTGEDWGSITLEEAIERISPDLQMPRS